MSKRKSTNYKRMCFPEEYKIIAFPPKLNEFRVEGLFCDGVVHCADNKLIKIHRAILSTASPYFKTVFLNTLNLNQNEKCVTFVDISSRFLNLLLDFAYTGSCQITTENVEELLMCADRFDVIGVIQLCCQYLRENLSPRNCFDILKIAKQYFCQCLQKKVQLYIRHNFSDIIVNPEEFNKLSEEEVRKILNDDELNVRREKIVYKAIKTWVKYDPNNRSYRIPNLLTCIRFDERDNNNLLERVLNWSWIDNDQKEIIEATSSASLVPSCIFLRSRIPYEVLFAIGGWSVGSPTNHIETYDVRADRWSSSRFTDQAPRAYHGVCALNMQVYIIGGYDGHNHFNTVRCFDPVTKAWKEKSCMHQARCYVSVVAQDGKIYALGGFNGMCRLSSGERYCPTKNQWEMIAPMNNPRSDASAASLQGKIYIVGGINGQEILTSGEVFDPENNQWTFIRPMSSPRSGVSLVAYCGFLYALGGFNGFIRLDTCEKINPIQMSDWEAVTNMGVTRSNFAAVILDEMIFAIGGFNGANTISTVECYDSRNEVWRKVSDMNLNRSALSACVIAGLPNARDYAVLRAPWDDGQATQSDSST